MQRPVRLTLRVATDAAEREAAIVEWMDDGAHAGAASGRLVIAEGALVDRSSPRGVPFVGLAAGCVCCVGWVTLRVALTRALRNWRPRAVLLLVLSGQHLPRLRDLLAGGKLGVAVDLVEGPER